MTQKKYKEQDPRQHNHPIGRKIVGMATLGSEDLALLGWDLRYGQIAFALLLDDGTYLIPAQDEEGNGPGCIYSADKDFDNIFGIRPV